MIVSYLHDVQLLPGHEDVLPVLAAPHDVRGRVSGGVTRQAHIIPLPDTKHQDHDNAVTLSPDHHVMALAGLRDCRRHNHLHIAAPVNICL